MATLSFGIYMPTRMSTCPRVSKCFIYGCSLILTGIKKTRLVGIPSPTHTYIHTYINSQWRILVRLRLLLSQRDDIPFKTTLYTIRLVVITSWLYSTPRTEEEASE